MDDARQNSDDTPVDAEALYTSKVDAHVAFNAAFRSSQAYEAFFASDENMQPALRILSAECRTGVDTLALVEALQRRGLGYREIDGFDLTPAMLARFQTTLDARGLGNVTPEASQRSESCNVADRMEQLRLDRLGRYA